MTISVSRHGFTFHSSFAADIEELAAVVRLRQRVSPGIQFARKIKVPNCRETEKFKARNEVLNYLESWSKPLSIFTMPGIRWPFERVLLGRRLNAGLQTNVWAVENEAPVYKASLQHIPGHKQGFRVINDRTVSTSLVSSFELCNAEDFILGPRCPKFDIAWFDFTGFLTEFRLKAIQHFWTHHCHHSIVITSLGARWDKQMSKAIKSAGNLPNLVSKALSASKLVSVLEYCEPSPMIQITLRRRWAR